MTGLELFREELARGEDGDAAAFSRIAERMSEEAEVADEIVFDTPGSDVRE